MCWSDFYPNTCPRVGMHSGIRAFIRLCARAVRSTTDASPVRSLARRMETDGGGEEVVFGRWRRGLVVEGEGRDLGTRGGVVEETRLRVCRADDEEADDETAATAMTVRFEDVEAWERVKRRDSKSWTWSSMGKKTRGMRLKTRARGDAGGEGETTTVWARERGSGGEDFCEVMEEALTRWERKNRERDRW